MTIHRGRLALLTRAAYEEVGPKERLALVKLGAPGHDPEHVLQTLKRVVELRKAWKGQEASALLEDLVQSPEGGA